MCLICAGVFSDHFIEHLLLSRPTSVTEFLKLVSIWSCVDKDLDLVGYVLNHRVYNINVRVASVTTQVNCYSICLNRSSSIRSGRQQRHSTDQWSMHHQVTYGKQSGLHPEGGPRTGDLQPVWADQQQPWFLHGNSSLAVSDAGHQRPWYHLLNVVTVITVR